MKRLLLVAFLSILAGCGTSAVRQSEPAPPPAAAGSKGSEVVMYALGLLDIDYRFGGSNPSSGLDCSGMVSYIYKNAAGVDLPHNAYRIAQTTRSLELSQIKPGDLVFFDTLGRPFSHVGIYIGNGRFVHAPGTNGKIKISNLSSGYYARKLDGIRSLF